MPLQISAGDDHVLRVLSALSDSIARATELREMYDAALDALRLGLGVDRASILLFDPEGVVRFVAWRGLSDPYRAAVEGHSPWRPGSLDAQPICVRDVRDAADLAAYGPVFEAEGIRALAFIPLLARGRVLGKFMCYHGEPHAFGDGEIALALTIAQQVAFAVERTHASEAMRRSEERLRFALDAASMGTWDWDLRTNGVVWSENLPRIHGLPDGAFDGSFQSYEREIHPADKPRVMESASRAITDGVPHDVEYRIVAPDGTVRWVEGKGRVEYGPDGRPVRMGGTCMNITRRKLAELERAELAARAAFLADVSTTLARSLDYSTTLRTLATAAVPRIADWCTVHMRHDDGTVVALAAAHADRGSVSWLRQHRDALRVRPDDAYGVALAMRTNTSQLYADVTNAQLEAIVPDAALREALRTLAVRSVMVVPIRTSGDVVGAITFMIAGDSPRRFASGDLALAEDVALRAGVAVENARLYSAAQEANRVKDEFLATLSHELRTPLNAILGWARMLEQGRVPRERWPHALGIIRRNAEAQATLISDLLDVARIASNKLHLDLEVVNVSDLVQLAVDGMESQARAGGVHVSVDAEPELTAWADPARLQQMAANLLSNALKFTPAGGRIHAQVRAVGDRVCIAVRDTGVGIRPDFLPHLFDPFRQADASTTRAYGGLGLGLAITRRLAELHGGAVEAASDGPGHGATLRVLLPLVRTSMRVSAPAPAVDGAIIAARLARRRVLVVDDDGDSRQLACEIFGRVGADVRPARSVAEAMEALSTTGFDLLVADIAMPVEDGFALMEQLSSRAAAEGDATPPAIALTAHARDEDRARVLAAGFAAHLAKPLDGMLLLETAAAVLSRSVQG